LAKHLNVLLRRTPLEVTALPGASKNVFRGESGRQVGCAGSGKSTLVQHFNGLLRPGEPGQVIVVAAILTIAVVSAWKRMGTGRAVAKM
jgi:energy-coupling factor transporter ATP-binding protein EcfA2